MLHSAYGEIDGGWLHIPEYLLFCYVEQLPKIQAQRTLMFMEAVWLGSPSNSDEEAAAKTKKLNELFSTIDPDYGKPKVASISKLEQKAKLMEMMALGFDVEVIEGAVV